MKLNKYSWLAALPLFFTACQEDMLVEKHTQQGVYTLTATMDGGVDSRAQIALNGTSTVKEAFLWNEGDVFTLFESDADNNVTKKEFAISETYSDESPSKKADFSSENALTVGSSFVAYYPSFDIPYANVDNDDEVSGQYYFWHPGYFQIQCEYVKDGDGYLTYDEVTTWKNYFKQYMFMKASGNVTDEGTEVSFEHLCGIIRITYTNKTNSSQNIKDVCVNGSWGTTAFVSETSTDIDKFYGNQEGLRLSFDAMYVNPDETKNFYILFFPPHNVPNEGIYPLTKIGVSHSSNQTEPEYIYTPSEYNGNTFSVSGFEAGKSYWFNITETGNEADGYSLTWTKELEGDGEEQEPDDSGDAPCFEVETLDELMNALNYENAAINFMNDIELTAPLTINNSVSLYLNNHKLSLMSGINYSADDKDAVITYNGSGELGIYDGTLETNDGTSPIHNYYIKNVNDGELYFSHVILNTGQAVSNAIYAGAKPCSTNNCIITTSGYAFYWYSSPENTNGFGCTHREITVNGDIYFECESDNYMDMSVYLYHGTINGNLVTKIPTGKNPYNICITEYYITIDKQQYTGWENVSYGADVTTRTVESWDDLVNAFEQEKNFKGNVWISLNNNITLQSALTVQRHVNIQMNGYTFSVAEDFDWKGGDAVFLNSDEDSQGEFFINNGKIEGPQSGTFADKYLFNQNSIQSTNLYGVEIVANKLLNAFHVNNGGCNLEEETTVNGNVKLTSGSITVSSGITINGTLTKDESGSVWIYEGANVTGEGWPTERH